MPSSDTLAVPASAKRLSDVELIERIATATFNPSLAFFTASNMSGLKRVLEEIIRNSTAADHGNAKSVEVHVVDGRELEIGDNGIGMDQASRECCAESLGKTTACGTGSGARLAAVTLCETMEYVTVPKDEPEVAYRISFHLPRFVVTTVLQIRENQWERIPRSASGFPAQWKHGTIVRLRDFRVCNPRAPLDRERYRDTSRQVSEEEARRIIPIIFRPNIARLVTVNGRHVATPVSDGYLLWQQEPCTVRGIGTVSGEIRFTEDSEGRWCTIGGTTTTVPMQTFIDDCREHNAPLWERIRRRELRDKNLCGYILGEILEQYPTQSREHFDPSFYAAEAAQVLVDFLNEEVATAIARKRAEYESRPATEATNQSLRRLIALMHERQHITPGVITGDGGSEGEDGTRAPLKVNRVTFVLTPVREGDDVRDSATFQVLNVLPGETFSWDDHGEGILDRTMLSANGDEVTVRSVAIEARYPIDVQSDRHPARRQRLAVVVRAPEGDRGGKAEEFRLAPQQVREMYVGEVKRIGVARIGRTSGVFTWSSVRCIGEHEDSVRAITVLQKGREVDFRALAPGDYVVRCVDAKDPQFVAECRIEVLARRPERSNDDSADAKTGTGSGNRKSVVSGVDGAFIMVFRDVRFVVRGGQFLTSVPWNIDPDDRTIFISDVHPGNTGARSPEERDTHIRWSLASAVRQYFTSVGDIGATDCEGAAHIEHEILELTRFDVRSRGGNGTAIAPRPPSKASAQRE